MKNIPKLIVMLTHNDKTVKNARQIFGEVKNSKAEYFGMKEEGIPEEEMIVLYGDIRKAGKIPVLEVVAYTERECLSGAELALKCRCEILMGTLFFDSVNDFCKKNNIKYMPFVGRVSERPSILEGEIDDIISEANCLIEKCVYGFDLLGYRHTKYPVELNYSFSQKVKAPVCIAGSVDSFERLDEIKNAQPWAFTIGGAFFENKFSGSFENEINEVYDYMNK